MSAAKILSLGQCAADSHSLTQLFQSQFQAEVVDADSFDEALALLQQEPFALVLVNRILDRTGDSGLDFIRQLQQDAKLKTLPVMLVSNFEDAQKKAVSHGAHLGFGKSGLHRPETLERLRAVLQKDSI